MKKLLTLSVMLLLAMLFVMAWTMSSGSSSTASGVLAVPSLADSSAAAEPTPVTPGIYAARPYSMIVIVPRSVDEGGVAKVNISESSMPVIKPEMRLERLWMISPGQTHL